MPIRTPRILIGEEFIGVQPSLIRALGGKVVEAVMLQYLHFWLRASTNEHEGETWVYNTFEEWSEKLGISPDQARRAMKRLEEWGEDGDRLVVSCKPKSEAWDHTKWYRINYKCSFFNESASGEIAGSMWQDRRIEGAESPDLPLTTERTTESSFVSSNDETASEAGEPCPTQQETVGNEDANAGRDARPGTERESLGSAQGAALSHQIGEDGTVPPEAEPESPAPSRPKGNSTGRRAWSPADEENPDVPRLCHLLADLYHEQGNTRPNPDQKLWYQACRLLLTKDGPDGTGWPVAKVENVLRWSQQDEFWRTNIRSMPKFREKYDMLRARALEEHRRNKAVRSVGKDQGRDILAKMRADLDREGA